MPDLATAARLFPPAEDVHTIHIPVLLDGKRRSGAHAAAADGGPAGPSGLVGTVLGRLAAHKPDVLLLVCADDGWLGGKARGGNPGQLALLALLPLGQPHHPSPRRCCLIKKIRPQTDS